MKKIALFLSLIFLILPLLGCNEKVSIVSYADGKYLTFEEAVTQYATDFVKAKCIGVKDNDVDVEYKFEVLARYLGEEVGDFIHVYTRKNYCHTAAGENIGISYYEDDISYITGEEYYLVIERFVGVYYDRDRYYTICNIYFPVSDLTKSTMYGELVTNHSGISDISGEQALVDYIVKMLENNPDRELYYGTKPIDARDMETVIKQSDFVFKVSVGKDCGYGLKDRTTHECTVIESLKGDITTSDITILFLKGDVSEGKEYIVALHQSDTSSFIVSSKNSVFKISKKDRIMKYIQ